ncbi:MAG TPA: cyclic pyranopterin monophosphate synthase MoaC [Vicinamibacteria bacterium]|nr:cyclic pyranopterin monophosphate synthase MoaC [Vicinamibacteria bacterium]
MARRSTKLTHLSPAGRVRMVDVGDKSVSQRQAVAAGRIRISPQAMEEVRQGRLAKGNVLETARLAGIMAAKRTAELVPLCHSLPLEHVEIEIRDIGSGFEIEASVRTTGKTGVEMEALTAVTVAALALYDMVKAADRTVVIGDVRLLRKSGGRSGLYVRREGKTKSP